MAHGKARRHNRPHDIALLLALARMGVLLVAVGAVSVLVFRLWLVDAGGHSLSEPWLIATLVLFVLAIALGAGGGRRPRKARLLAARLAQDNEPATPELRRVLDDRASMAANYLAALAVLVILRLMVWQPEVE